VVFYRFSSDRVTAECGRQHNEELRGLYSSSIVIRVFKSRIIRLVGYVARMG